MAAASVMAAQFAGVAVLGFLLGLFMASRFLPRGGGPTRRVLRVVGLAVLALIRGTFWGAAAGLVNWLAGCSVSPTGRGGYPALAGGLWLCRTLVRSRFQAVVVPSGLRTRVQPQRWMTTW